MALILDTNVISRMRRMERTPPAFRHWAQGVDHEAVYLSAITLMEIENGIIGAEHRDRPFAAILRTWQDQVLARFAGRIIPVDHGVALRCARLNAIRSIDVPDALIAATALDHRLTLVTHNVRHFTGFGLDILNPFPA